MGDVTKDAPQQGIKNLGRACANFFSDLAKYKRKEIPWNRVRRPRFKKKGQRDGFRADPGTDATRAQAVNVSANNLRLPRIAWVTMREAVRFAGKILSCTVPRQGNAWFASLCIEVPYEVDPRAGSSIVVPTWALPHWQP
jgi:putative transposase